jgi:hypothetical protein
MPYVSITGLQLKSVLNAPAFWWHAVRSMGQAQAAPGNISAEARTINGIHHTLTVWESEAAMRAYLVSGPHLAAMKAFRGMATGKTLGLEAETPPGWDEVHALWQDRGRQV